MKELARFLLALGLVAGPCIAFTPVWQTNDDVAMAMVAHGYGFAAFGSPNVLFSTTAWGHIVRALDGLFGLQGYSVAMFGALVLAAWAMLHSLARLSVGLAVALPTVAAVIVWPVLFPQFTVTAGVAAVAAVLGVHCYALTGDRRLLAIAAGMLILGFLIRPLEAMLIGVIGLPFVPWRALRVDRTLQLACAGTLLAIGIAQAADMTAYRSNAWQAFSTANQARAPYTDFGMGDRVKARPDVLARHGYSANDVALVSNWFFEDPALVRPDALDAMRQEAGVAVGPLRTSRLSIGSGARGLMQLAALPMLAQLGAALLLLALGFRLHLAAAWVAAGAIVFGLGFGGAPVHARVLFPMAVLLLVMGVACVRHRHAPAITAAMLVSALLLIAPKALASGDRVARAQAHLPRGPEPVFIWGDALDLEASFPPLMPVAARATAPPLYALGVMRHAPFSVAVREAAAARGLIDRLRAPGGLSIVASDARLDLLARYCRERLGRTLVGMASTRPGVHTIHCTAQ